MNFKYLIFLCLMFIVSMGAVSAADDVNSTFNANIDVNDVPVDSVIIDNPICENAKEYTITNDNYGLHHFFSGFCEYLRQKGESVEYDQIQNDVCNLILSRSTDLAEFLSKKISRDDLLQNTENKYIVEFLDYLLLCERERPNDVLSYKRLYNGAIQASLLGFSPTNKS